MAAAVEWKGLARREVGDLGDRVAERRGWEERTSDRIYISDRKSRTATADGGCVFVDEPNSKWFVGG